MQEVYNILCHCNYLKDFVFLKISLVNKILITKFLVCILIINNLPLATSTSYYSGYSDIVVLFFFYNRDLGNRVRIVTTPTSTNGMQVAGQQGRRQNLTDDVIPRTSFSFSSILLTLFRVRVSLYA